ncbi:hypothetical protein ACIQVK_51420 [Streptomyces sp. NPDC090493]|uniref:hypothetical protein n=1 Tax=Streptomyces sp. NPDC090493 TaxID=3365964 RepID=UPI00382F252F
MRSRLHRPPARLAVHCLPRAARPERNHLNDPLVPWNRRSRSDTRALLVTTLAATSGSVSSVVLTATDLPGADPERSAGPRLVILGHGPA